MANTMLEWNQATGNWEAEFGGHTIIVSGDVIYETFNQAAQSAFHLPYNDLDDEQTAEVDAVVLNAQGWDDPDHYAAVPEASEITAFDQVTEGMKATLVEQLCGDSDVRPAWTPGQAWEAAEDPDNWEYAADGTVRAHVIATSDEYEA